MIKWYKNFVIAKQFSSGNSWAIKKWLIFIFHLFLIFCVTSSGVAYSYPNTGFNNFIQASLDCAETDASNCQFCHPLRESSSIWSFDTSSFFHTFDLAVDVQKKSKIIFHSSPRSSIPPTPRIAFHAYIQKAVIVSSPFLLLKLPIKFTVSRDRVFWSFLLLCFNVCFLGGARRPPEDFRWLPWRAPPAVFSLFFFLSVLFFLFLLPSVLAEKR